VVRWLKAESRSRATGQFALIDVLRVDLGFDVRLSASGTTIMIASPRDHADRVHIGLKHLPFWARDLDALELVSRDLASTNSPILPSISGSLGDLLLDRGRSGYLQFVSESAAVWAVCRDQLGDRPPTDRRAFELGSVFWSAERASASKDVTPSFSVLISLVSLSLNHAAP